jgi:DNA-binding NarL/FixJ family response regulator
MIRLLIADDNAEFRKSTEMMVSLESDIQVISLARDGHEAVELAKQHHPDVAVIDVHMPKVDGLTAIRALATASPQTVCMAMSYDGEREILRQAMAAGAREYLIKPFNSHELVTAVRRVAPRPRLEATPSVTVTVSPPPPPPIPGSTPATKSKPSTAPPPRPVVADKAREQKLKQLTVEYLRSDRSDPEALQVYAELVTFPSLDAASLTALAEVFLQRREWHTLRLICDRMEKLTQPEHG